MRTVRRISAVDHEYAGRQLKVGDEFECELNDVEFMLALGRIAPDILPGRQTYKTRDMRRRKAA